jgi:hypothetical protein
MRRREEIVTESSATNRVDARFVALLSTIAFALHFGWENAQCIAFFVHASTAPTQVDMVRATLGDVAMTWLAYGAVSLATRQWNWPFGRWAWKEWGSLVSTALVMSVAVERLAIASGRWSYTANNPLVPGTEVSILPVAQLLLLFPLAFWLTAWIAGRAPATSQRK